MTFSGPMFLTYSKRCSAVPEPSDQRRDPASIPGTTWEALGSGSITLRTGQPSLATPF